MRVYQHKRLKAQHNSQLSFVIWEHHDAGSRPVAWCDDARYAKAIADALNKNPPKTRVAKRSQHTSEKSD